MSRISFVFAQSKNGVIGRNGQLPWHVPGDLKRFKAITMGKPVIMGRKTWDSLPVRPLPGRKNIVLTRQKHFAGMGADVATSVEHALHLAGEVEEICVIGGAEIFQAFMPLCNRIYVTEIDVVAAGDALAPTVDPRQWTEVSQEFHAGPPPFVLRVLERT